MRLPAATTALSACLLAACSGGSDSRLNPAALFGQAEATSLAPEGGYPPDVSDTRPLVAQITALRLETTPGGAIVRAEGMPPTTGFFAPDLVRVGGDEGAELRFEFRLRPPPPGAPVGSEATRRVSAGAFVTAAELQRVRRITVTAARNSRSLSR